MKAAVVYRFYNANHELLYVGCSSDFLTRMASHRLSRDWFDEVAKVTVAHFDDTLTAYEMESVAIATEHPRYNTQHSIERSGKRLESRGRAEAAHAAGERCERQHCWHCNTQRAIRMVGGVDEFITLLATGYSNARSVIRDLGWTDLSLGEVSRWVERYARRIEDFKAAEAKTPEGEAAA